MRADEVRLAILVAFQAVQHCARSSRKYLLASKVGMLVLPTILGQKRRHSAVKDTPYECGMPPITDAHARFSVKFYLIAMLFILFDIEVIFFLGWGAVYRDLIQPQAAGGIGVRMLLGALVFLVILEVGHIYCWKKGALDWAPRKKPQVAP